MGLLGVIGALDQRQARAIAEGQVREVLGGLRSQLDAVTEASFSASANLENLLRISGQLDATAFRLTVENMLAGQHQLRNVVVAPNDVVTMLHPLAGNERVLGLDYRSVPAQWAQVERARQLRTPLIFAPVPLVQGGKGVVQRRPIFLRGPDGEPRYWGVISSVADVDRFVTRAGLRQATVELALVERRADGQPGGLIWGDGRLLGQAVQRTDLQLPGATWTLLGRPRGGWERPLSQSLPLMAGLLTSLIIVAGSGLLARRRWQLALRQQALEHEIEARTASQREAEQAQSRLKVLLATASDWFWEQDEHLRLSYISNAMPGRDGLANSLGQRRWDQPDLVPGEPDSTRWAEHRAQLQRREPFRDFRYARQAPGKAKRWYSISGDPVFAPDGRFMGYRGTGRDVTTEQELADALASTRERLQAVMAAATRVAIIATDLDDRITEFNSGAEQLLGYPAATVIGSSPRRFHDPEEMASRAAALSLRLGRDVAVDEVFTAGGSEPMLWTMRRRDGSTVPALLTVTELRDSGGQLIGHLGVAVDMSAEQSTQAQLRRTATRLQAVLDSAAGVAIVTCSVDGRVEIFNRGAEEILGCSAADAVGTPAVRFHLRSEVEQRARELAAPGQPPLPWNEVFLRQAAGRDGGSTWLWTYVRADGGHRQVAHTFSALHEADGSVIGYLAIARDVSVEVQAQQALQTSTERLQAVLDSALDIAVLVVDFQGRVQLFSKGAERLFGYAAAEVIGQSSLMLHCADELRERSEALAAELGRPVHRHEVFMLPLEAGGGSSVSTWTYIRRDGSRIPGQLRLRRMVGSDGSTTGFLAVATDASAELQAQAVLEQRVQERTLALAATQEELLRSERLAALGSLVAGVAHELNTPLGTSLTAASTLEDRTRELQRDLAAGQLKRSTLDAYARDAATMAELLLKSLRSAADLVQHFKQLSVDQTGDNRRRFELGAIVDDVLTVLRPQLKGSRIRVDTEIALETPIDAYPGELGRLLTNLVLNAQLHAFEPGADGRVSIRARALRGGRYELVVADNGRGMPEDVRRRAFDPFFTTRLGQGGSGLGLNIVWNIATGVLGGTVRLDSKPGEGTRFTFELPLVAPQRGTDDGADFRPTSTAPRAGGAEHGEPRARRVQR